MRLKKLIGNYFFKPTHTVDVRDLNKNNMMIRLYRIERILESLEKNDCQSLAGYAMKKIAVILLNFIFLSAGICSAPYKMPGKGAGQVKRSTAEETNGNSLIAEEISIQNNAALRDFYLKRYSLIFRGEMLYGGPTEFYINSDFRDPMGSRYNSGQRIFRDNYIARQIEDFSAELRASLERLGRARLILQGAEESGSINGGGGCSGYHATEEFIGRDIKRRLSSWEDSRSSASKPSGFARN